MSIHLRLPIVVLGLFIGIQTLEAEPYDVRCHFERYAGLSGDVFDPSKAEILETEFELLFVIDAEMGRAYVVGNVGTAEVQLVPVDSGDGGFIFLEQSPSGTVQVTAIDANSDAVHSRHTMLSGELVPSQYYGWCE
jgi:hypothetical protein